MAKTAIFLNAILSCSQCCSTEFFFVPKFFLFLFIQLEHPLSISLSSFLSTDCTPICELDPAAKNSTAKLPDSTATKRTSAPTPVNSESCYFLACNRNKRSIALDFRKPAGRQLLLVSIAESLGCLRSVSLNLQPLDMSCLMSTPTHLINISPPGSVLLQPSEPNEEFPTK